MMIDLDELRIVLQTKMKRHTPFYKIVKEELMKLGYWKNRPRGNARKGYEMGMGRHSHPSKGCSKD